MKRDLLCATIQRGHGKRDDDKTVDENNFINRYMLNTEIYVISICHVESSVVKLRRIIAMC